MSPNLTWFEVKREIRTKLIIDERFTIGPDYPEDAILAILPRQVGMVNIDI